MAFMLARLKVPLTWREILRRTFDEAFFKDNCLGMAAQLAYYFFFALFPALLVVLVIASSFSSDPDFVGKMFLLLDGFVPPRGPADHHRAAVEDSRQPGRSAHRRHADGALEQLGGHDRHHRHAQLGLRHRGRARLVESPLSPPSSSPSRRRLHRRLVRPRAGRADAGRAAGQLVRARRRRSNGAGRSCSGRSSSRSSAPASRSSTTSRPTPSRTGSG